MNRILYENRCRCNEDFSITKKRKSSTISEGKPIPYPTSSEILSKTFQVKYPNKLSVTSKAILNSLSNKYIYYAIDDILYTLKSFPTERDMLLAMFYSPVISLQNNFSINFFDIWIRQIYIEEVLKTNRFCTNNTKILNQSSYITIEFFYKTKLPIKKQESLW